MPRAALIGRLDFGNTICMKTIFPAVLSVLTLAVAPARADKIADEWIRQVERQIAAIEKAEKPIIAAALPAVQDDLRTLRARPDYEASVKASGPPPYYVQDSLDEVVHLIAASASDRNLHALVNGVGGTLHYGALLAPTEEAKAAFKSAQKNLNALDKRLRAVRELKCGVSEAKEGRVASCLFPLEGGNLANSGVQLPQDLVPTLVRAGYRNQVYREVRELAQYINQDAANVDSKSVEWRLLGIQSSATKGLLDASVAVAKFKISARNKVRVNIRAEDIIHQGAVSPDAQERLSAIGRSIQVPAFE
jgi:hypothetical protein